MDGSRIGAIPFFADLPDDELATVARVASEVEILSVHGSHGERMHVRAAPRTD